MTKGFSEKDRQVIKDAGFVLIRGRLVKLFKPVEPEFIDPLSVAQWVALFREYQQTSTSEAELIKSYGISKEVFHKQKKVFEQILKEET